MSIFQTANDPNASGQATLNDLVGEGKKFKTVDDLAKAKLESDRFIERLQTEQRELRDELNKRLTTEEALRKAQEAGTVEPRTQSEPAPVQKRQEEQPNITSEVERVLAQREQANKLRSNIDTVTARMTELYDTVEKAAEVVQRKATELDMSVAQLQKLASDNPKAFFKLIGAEDKPKGDSGTSWQRSKNPAALKDANKSTTAQPGTYKYYEEIRRSDPAAYFSPRVQLQMDKDAREKGDKFYS